MKYGTRANRVLRLALWIGAALTTAVAWNANLVSYTIGVDMEIPLRAAERWLAGGQPYLASSFTNVGGVTQPFMYPPYVLPFLAPLTLLPRWLVLVPWLTLLFAAAIWTCRRLGVPLRWIPAILVWPPFAEPLIGGNVQVLLFASFVALFWRGTGRQPESRDLRDPGELSVTIGLRAGVIALLKVGQFQPWLHVARWRPRAALLAVAVGVGLVMVTLPLVGVDAWRSWVDQLARATNLAWRFGGFSLSRLLPASGLFISVVASLAVLLVRPNGGGRTVGILTVIGAPSLYMFGLLFLLPAMLWCRREMGLLSAALIAMSTISYEGAWIGVMLVALIHVGAMRGEELREPGGPGWGLGPSPGRH